MDSREGWTGTGTESETEAEIEAREDCGGCSVVVE
jgi:hypothetical protein